MLPGITQLAFSPMVGEELRVLSTWFKKCVEMGSLRITEVVQSSLNMNGNIQVGTPCMQEHR